MDSNKETNGEPLGRVVVGECPSCHRPLKVKASAVKRVMHLTCKCGERTVIQKVEQQDPITELISEGAWDRVIRFGNYATNALVKALHHKDASIRMKAAESLGSIGDLAAIRPLLQVRGDSYIEQAAAEALVKLGRLAVPELIAELDGGDSHRAAEVLGHIDDLRAVEPLIDMVKDIYRNRHMAAHALKLLTAQDFGLSADSWEQWWRQNRPGLMELDALFRQLDDSDPKVRESAARSLGELRDPRAIPNLLKRLNDDWQFIINAASQSLSQIHPDWLDLVSARREVPALCALVDAIGTHDVAARAIAHQVAKRYDFYNQAKIERLLNAPDRAAARRKAIREFSSFTHCMVVDILCSIAADRIMLKDDIRIPAVRILQSLTGSTRDRAIGTLRSYADDEVYSYAQDCPAQQALEMLR